jgi:hypothetical protein
MAVGFIILVAYFLCCVCKFYYKLSDIWLQFIDDVQQFFSPLLYEHM